MFPRNLIGLLAREGNVFILGAGASAGLMPTMGAFPYPLLSGAADELGGFPAGIPYVGGLADHLGLDFNPSAAITRGFRGYQDARDHTYLSHSYPVVHKLFYDRFMATLPLIDSSCPCQYAIFRLIARGSAAVITLNNDGLATEYVKHLRVYELHGAPTLVRISGRIVRVARSALIGYLSENIDVASLYGVDVLPEAFNVIVRPGDPEVDLLWKLPSVVLRNATAIICIGCSFNPVYDTQLRERLHYLLAGRKTDLHVIDRNAETIAEDLSDMVRTHVCAWTIDWECFSRALVDSARSNGERRLLDLSRHDGDVRRRYHKLLGC